VTAMITNGTILTGSARSFQFNACPIHGWKYKLNIK